MAYECVRLVLSRDVNKDLTPKDQDKDKDLIHKDQDKDKDLTPKDQDKDKVLTPKDQDKDLKNVLKESLRTRTRTRINIPALFLELIEAKAPLFDHGCCGALYKYLNTIPR